jgi:outer membrane protein
MKEAIIVANQSYAVSVKNEERGRELMEVGKMSKADLAQLTAQRASDKYTLVNAESNLTNYKLQLKQLLELTGNDDFDIHTPEISDEDALTDIPQLQSIYESALVLRPEIRKSILSIEAGNTNLSIAKAGYLPTISITGGGGTSSTSMTSKNWGTQLKTNFDASVGATISIPISDNRKTKTAISKAKIEQAESMLDLEDKKKQIYYAIDSYWLDATTNQQKFIAAIDDVRSEEASYELLSEQFELGMKNIIELMSGKTNLINARYNKLQSKYMAILNIQLLNFYKGDKIDI